MADQADPNPQTDEEEDLETTIALVRQVPLGIVFARIIVVTCMSFAAAMAIFLLVAGAWVGALACVGVTFVFLFLMFFIERFADHESTSA